jgi:hypothetical protein
MTSLMIFNENLDHIFILKKLINNYLTINNSLISVRNLKLK